MLHIAGSLLSILAVQDVYDAVRPLLVREKVLGERDDARVVRPDLLKVRRRGKGYHFHTLRHSHQPPSPPPPTMSRRWRGSGTCTRSPISGGRTTRPSSWPCPWCSMRSDWPAGDGLVPPVRRLCWAAALVQQARQAVHLAPVGGVVAWARMTTAWMAGSGRASPLVGMALADWMAAAPVWRVAASCLRSGRPLGHAWPPCSGRRRSRLHCAAEAPAGLAPVPRAPHHLLCGAEVGEVTACRWCPAQRVAVVGMVLVAAVPVW